KQWSRASLGVLGLIREYGLRDSSGPETTRDNRAGAAAPGATGGDGGGGDGGHRRRPEDRVEGMRSLYVRLLSASGKIPRYVEGGEGASSVVRQVLAD
ncbi:unnamed protein product, partial [Laminaria digitata]